MCQWFLDFDVPMVFYDSYFEYNFHTRARTPHSTHAHPTRTLHVYKQPVTKLKTEDHVLLEITEIQLRKRQTCCNLFVAPRVRDRLILIRDKPRWDTSVDPSDRHWRTACTPATLANRATNRSLVCLTIASEASRRRRTTLIIGKCRIFSKVTCT